jgi:biopolymer transport protein ExbD
MKFRTRAFREEPEINFIPLIDVLLVILIFLMVTTTYSRFSELQINLPTADAGKPPERPEQIDVAVDPQGKYVVNKSPVTFSNAEALSRDLRLFRSTGGNTSSSPCALASFSCSSS